MPAEPPTVVDEIRSLYQGPLAEFTAARQALAKRLKQAGDARHGEVRELRKPPLSAWAVNRLFAEEAAAMAGLAGAGERARAVRQEAAEGGGDAAAGLRDLLATIRAETERLTGRGVDILAAGERAPGEAIVKRLRTSLEALAFDPETAAVAARGWLDADLAPPGFEVIAALSLAASPARPSPRARAEDASPAPASRRPAGASVHSFDAARRAAVERQERQARARRERLEKARSALTRAEAEASAERRRAERTGREADRAQEEAASAERLAEAAREKVRTARRAAEEAGARAKAAEAKAARAREDLAQAEGA